MAIILPNSAFPLLSDRDSIPKLIQIFKIIDSTLIYDIFKNINYFMHLYLTFMSYISFYVHLIIFPLHMMIVLPCLYIDYIIVI